MGYTPIYAGGLHSKNGVAANQFDVPTRLDLASAAGQFWPPFQTQPQLPVSGQRAQFTLVTGFRHVLALPPIALFLDQTWFGMSGDNDFPAVIQQFFCPRRKCIMHLVSVAVYLFYLVAVVIGLSPKRDGVAFDMGRFVSCAAVRALVLRCVAFSDCIMRCNVPCCRMPAAMWLQRRTTASFGRLILHISSCWKLAFGSGPSPAWSRR